jgi:2-polyprenyl-6-methoxyphenol hydroxylase-like FAD-dependent oxidoreductase
MSNLRILVVGASIAGPTAAYWFAKIGAKVTVIERFPQLRSGGQNVDIRTAGVSVMRKMPGMEDAVRASLVPVEGISLVREDGQSYGIMKASGDSEQQSLISEYEVLRGDLSRIIYGLTKDHPNVEYAFGEQVASIHQEQDDGPARVEFMNGRTTSEYDLVVACDGAASRTRAIGLGCGIRDHISPINSWVVYFTTKEDLLNGSQIVQAHNAPAGRFFVIGPEPSGNNRAVMMGINPRNGPDAVQAFREANKLGPTALKKYVAQYFKGAGWKSEAIIRNMIESDDLYGSEMIQVKLPTLHRGRFVTVGDAGYATGPTGTGTSLALAGAYVLAGEIGKHPHDLAAGLKGYEQQMRPLIDEMQKIPPLVPAIMGPQSAWGIWLRNNVFAFICWSNLPKLMHKLFGGASAHTNDIRLPEYKWAA